MRRFKYLKYILISNGGQREQVKGRVKKGAVVIRKVWELGKRRFGKDWAKRLWLFDRLG